MDRVAFYLYTSTSNSEDKLHELYKQNMHNMRNSLKNNKKYITI